MPDLEPIRELIRDVLDRRNWSLRDLATEARLSPATLSHIMTGDVEQPSTTTLKKLAPLLGAEVDALFALAGHKVGAVDQRPLSRDELLDRLQAVDAIEVPVYDIEASAAPSRHLLADEPDDYRYLPARRHYRRGRVRAIRINGRCMEPALRDGDEVFIDTEAEHQDGQPVLAVVGDALHIKRLTSRGDGWALAPENGGGEIVVDDSVHILGVVIGVWRQLAL